MKITNDEYSPLIESENQNIKYYAVFYDVKNNLNKIEITKNIFLQIFGTHKVKIINGNTYYFINYKDHLNICEIQLTKKDYKNFNSFKSVNIRYKNIYSRYIEQLDYTDEYLYKYMIYDSGHIEDEVYKKILNEEIKDALLSLNKIQRSRFIMYYFDDMTYEEIAKIEGCTKRAIKFSVDAARKNLQKMLKNLYLDYTNQ